MPKYKPKLGDVVTFTQYLGEITREAIETAGENGEEFIQVPMVPNPEPNQVATVVGVGTRRVGAKVEWAEPWGEEDGYWYKTWCDDRRQTFYILKISLRGRRYFVALEDLQVCRAPAAI